MRALIQKLQKVGLKMSFRQKWQLVKLQILTEAASQVLSRANSSKCDEVGNEDCNLSFFLLLTSSVSFAAERCFNEYAAEQDRSGLTYQSVNRQGNIARELTFQADRGLLSVLVFNQKVSNEEALKNFDLLLKAKYEESELAQVNPKRLAESFNFAQKLVFPSSSKSQAP